MHAGGTQSNQAAMAWLRSQPDFDGQVRPQHVDPLRRNFGIEGDKLAALMADLTWNFRRSGEVAANPTVAAGRASKSLQFGGAVMEGSKALFAGLLNAPQTSGPMYPVLSAGRDSYTTEAGTSITYPESFPDSYRRYIVSAPMHAEMSADEVSAHVSMWFRSEVTENGRLPIHIYEIEVQGRRLALISSGDDDFYFGIGEVRAINSTTSRMISVNMKEVNEERWGYFSEDGQRLRKVAKMLGGSAQ